ncbi:SDR family oxidoreductase, partial [uncultured Methylobacterium sp.]|uniref:SDR family NAD(P)-dependent oxidoreductase n=1 Tax=uncultured Methylobacterium sp. TaxID=157278 RepID=UPI002598D65A
MADRPLFGEGAAFVIGGSGGVGQAICQALAEAGANVALTYRSNEEKARGLMRAIEGQGRRAVALPLDLTDRAGTAAAVAEVAAEFGGIHSLVLATGADISMSYTAEIDPDEWDRTIAGDLTGSFNVLRAAIPHLRAARGAVVAITSAGLVRHPPKDILSVVPKAGVEALMRGIAREEGRWGVRANAIALGVIDTGLFHRLEQRLSPDFVEAMRRNTALRRFGTAGEVADLAVF